MYRERSVGSWNGFNQIVKFLRVDKAEDISKLDNLFSFPVHNSIITFYPFVILLYLICLDKLVEGLVEEASLYLIGGRCQVC